jgi:hypothetical protein
MTNLAEMVVNATADIVAETFTKQELSRILRMNGFDPSGVRLEHSPAGDTDVAMFADFLQKAGDKITWDAGDEMWLRQMVGMPEKSLEQLEQAHEEQEQEREANRKMFMPRGKQTAQDVEENSAVLYSTDKPTDERKRRKIENQWNDALYKFQQKQMRRVLESAKTLRSG